MSAWGWDGTAPGATACGVIRDGEGDPRERARAEAEAWLRAHPDGTVRLGVVRFRFDVFDLAAVWDAAALPERARWHRGEVVWEIAAVLR